MHAGVYNSGPTVAALALTSSGLSAAQLAHAPPSMVRQVMSATCAAGSWANQR